MVVAVLLWLIFVKKVLFIFIFLTATTTSAGSSSSTVVVVEAIKIHFILSCLLSKTH